MAALEASLSIFSLYPSSYSKLTFTHRTSHSMSLRSSVFTHSICLKHPLYPLPLLYTDPTAKFCFEMCSAVQELEVEAKPEANQEPNQKRKLFVLNLPWSLSVVDIKNLFRECGTVTDVEVFSVYFFSLIRSMLSSANGGFIFFLNFRL